MYLNKAILIGNLTRDPELKVIASGNKVCSFSLATNRTYKDKNGVKQEKTEFHNIVVWGKTAENVAQYMRKGSQILVEGRMETRSWDDASGVKKYRTEVIADIIQFGPRPAGGAGGYTGAPGGTKTSVDDDHKKAMDTIEYPEEEINPEDIPF